MSPHHGIYIFYICGATTHAMILQVPINISGNHSAAITGMEPHEELGILIMPRLTAAGCHCSWRGGASHAITRGAEKTPKSDQGYGGASITGGLSTYQQPEGWPLNVLLAQGGRSPLRT